MRGNRTESGTGGGSDEGLFDPFAPSPRGFTGEPSWYDNAKDWVVDAAGLATLVGYAVDTTSGATLTVADAVRRGWRGLRRRRLRAGADADRSPQPARAAAPTHVRETTILLLGLGATGKTTLVRNLLGLDEADNTRATKEITLYSMQQIRSAHDETGSTRAVHLYQIIDYRGQNMSELADWLDRFRNDDRSPFHPSRIDVVLLLVDLFETPDGVERGSASAPEAGRVGLHTSEWGNLILDIVLRYVRWERLSCLCLFVNKLDLLASPDPAGDAKAAFEPLLQRLAKRAETARHRREEQRPGERFRPIETVCLAGSLRSGQGVPELERALRRAGRTPQLAGAGDA